MADAELPDFGLDHITPDHYIGFGMIIHLTNLLDSNLDRIVVAMTKTANEPTFYPILSFLSNKDKRDYIVAMAKVATWPEYASKGLVDLMDRVKSAFSIRNEVAHCTWKKGRRKATIKPISLSARGVMKILGSGHNEKEWTATELVVEAKKIFQLLNELTAFMERYGLVPPSPDRHLAALAPTPGHKADKRSRGP